jgi:hypothetical protein
VHIFEISPRAFINKNFITFNTWTLLPFNQWYHTKFQI